MRAIYLFAAVVLLSLSQSALSDNTNPDVTQQAAALSDQELLELTGYLYAAAAAEALYLNDLDAKSIEAATAAFKDALAGKSARSDIPKGDLRQGHVQIQKRYKAIQALPKLDDRGLYIVGQNSARATGEELGVLGDAEREHIAKGYAEGIARQPARILADADRSAQWRAAQRFWKKRHAEFRAAERREFLSALESENGVKKTESGLYFKVLEPGNGSAPKLSDSVLAHYKGSLVDGTVFDSTYDRGLPARFALNDVVPGFAEGLTKVAPGGKVLIYVPSKLGYGDSPPHRSGILPGDLMIFETDLISIE